MKKVIRILLIYICFLILLVSFVDASTGKVTAKRVRLRRDNNTKADIITNINKDEKVEILGEKDGWYNVKYKSFTGYVSKDYVEEVVEEQVADTTNTEESAAEKQPEATNSEQVEDEVQEEVVKESIIGKEFKLQKDTNLRLNPNFSSIILENLVKDTNVTVIAELGKWIKISVNNSNGWICKNKIEVSNIEIIPDEENITPEETTSVENTVPEETIPEENTKPEEKPNTTYEPKKGYVNVETVNVRDSASLSGKRLGFLDLNNEVEIIGEDGDWYKIKTKKYGECYIYKSLVSPNKVASRESEDQRDTTVSQDKNDQLTNSLTNATVASNQGEQIVEFAKQYLGYAYVYAGKRPETGFDCSGYTRYVYSNFGISLGSTAASQANNSGIEVARGDLQPGDLILFQDDARTRIGHCGIYIGNNMFIHAANPKRGVVTDKLEGNSYYSPRFVSAYRF